MSTAQVERVTAVDVMVECLLYQILRLVACQLCNPDTHTYTQRVHESLPTYKHTHTLIDKYGQKFTYTCKEHVLYIMAVLIINGFSHVSVMNEWNTYYFVTNNNEV